MAAQYPVNGVAFTFPVQLLAQSDGTIKANPTLASGDVQVSKDGAAYANLDSLPTVAPAGSADVVVALTATEMTADRVVVRFLDASGAEWHTLSATIYPQARNPHDSVAQTGDAYALANGANGFAAIKSQTAAIETDTQDVQGRLPAALVSGRMASDAVAISGSTAAADAVEANIGNLDDAITDAVAAPAAALNAYDPPTNAELEARTLAAAAYATAAAQATAQADLDVLTGSDGATLATSQPNYAPATAANVASALSTYDGPTNAEMEARTLASASYATAAELAKVPKSDGTTTWNATAAGQIQQEAQDAIEANHLDHLLATAYDPASKPGAADALLNELVESDAGVSRFTANALEQAPSGGSAPTAGEIADAVCDEALAGHATAGTVGVALSTIQANTANLGSGSVTVRTPVVASDDIHIEQGDDYGGDDIVLSVAGAPDLTGSTTTFRVRGLEKAVTLVSTGGATQTMRLELTAAETGALAARIHPFELQATLAGGTVRTLVRGKLHVRGDL